MITTVTEQYKAVLDGIKKESTAIVPPAVFNRIINDGQIEWVSQNITVTERDQKQIDDLEKLRCHTDGSFEDNTQSPAVILYPVAPYTSDDKLFALPKYTLSSIRNRQDDGSISTQTYPRYLKLLNIKFKITYGSDNECDLTGVSEWLKAKIMRSDQKVVIESNPYRSPKDSRLYYEFLDGKVKLITGTAATGYAMKMEYYRYPAEIFFDDSISPTHIDCEFGPIPQREIVDITVRNYLERVKDPRYQSFLQEEAIKARNK